MTYAANENALIQIAEYNAFIILITVAVNICCQSQNP